MKKKKLFSVRWKKRRLEFSFPSSSTRVEKNEKILFPRKFHLYFIANVERGRIDIESFSDDGGKGK